MQNKVVLITGAAKRIGAAIARYLHAQQMNIVVHYHQSHTQAMALTQELNELRANSARAIQANLIETQHHVAFIEQVKFTWGRLDALINNASAFTSNVIHDTKENDWEELMAINLKAPFFLCQAAADELARQQGTIVNIADIHGDKPLKGYPIYSISKAGLLMLTKALAQELAPVVRVNAISPAGGCLWPEGENALTQDVKETIINKTLLKRQGSPLDIAKAALYCIRDAEYVTGQVLVVDGGRTVA